MNTQNQITSIISPAWARNAKGNEVNTFFTVNGNQLIQHIDFDQNSIFPIVADPNWVKITLCAGALGWLVGSAVVAPAKLLKIKRYIQALGGLREAAALMVGATHLQRKCKEVVKL
ncbi:MAG: hypothetical protein LBF32_01060 [Streptococcaceae bacterium]|nr:hypothetical protein [Streptococcaceae bacterium]